jgi:hippurate hydrolase
MAENTARAAGMAENELPEVNLVDTPALPVLNTIALVQRLKAAWIAQMGTNAFGEEVFREGMGAEDFPQFTTEPYIPSVYFTVGGTPAEDIARASAGTLTLPTHHSPLFKIAQGPAVKTGVEATVVALHELMPKK